MRKAILSCTAAVLILAAAIWIYFAAATMNFDEMTDYCRTNSTISSQEFDVYGSSSLSRYCPSRYYRLFVSSDPKIPDQQELFIFQNVPLFGLDINRSRLETPQTKTQFGMIGTAIFEPRTATGEKTGQTVLLLYSSNPENIVHYELFLQDNGKDITVTGGVGMDSFIIDVPLGYGGIVTTQFISGKFYDINYNLIEEISNENP